MRESWRIKILKTVTSRGRSHIKLPYRPDVDGLRAFSVIAVLVFHAFPSLLPGGFIGVDVFFVISGYLISLIISQELTLGTFSIRGFYRRRLQRIVPALIPILLSCLVIGWYVLLPGEYRALGKHITAASTFSSNWVLWNESGYFYTNSEYKPLLHLWSLGVEEQFYLVWPLLVVVGYRVGIRLPLLILTALSFIICVASNELDRATPFFLPQYRAWELLVGASLVWFGAPKPLGQKLRPETLNTLTSGTGLLLLATSVLMMDETYGWPGWPSWWTMIPITGAALLILSGPHSIINRWVLGNKLMVMVGKISFPLYLWHWPLLAFARIMESGEPPPDVRLIILVSSFFLAWGSYQLIEKPLRYSRNLLTPIGLVAALLSLGVAGLTIMQLHGVPSRKAEFQALVDNSHWANAMKVPCPKRLEELDSLCTSNRLPPKIAVLGDSHAHDLFFALASHYEAAEIGIEGFSKGGCPPLYSTETPARGRYDCQTAANGNIDYVASSKEITTVYLSSAATNLQPEQKQNRPGSKEALSHHNKSVISRRGLENTINRLLEADKQIVLVFDWPTIPFSPKSCIGIRPVKLIGKIRSNCYMPKNDYLKQNKAYREFLYSILRKYPSIKYWDTSKAFCDTEVCWIKKNGRILYRDKNHMSLTGYRFLGEHLELESLSPVQK